MVMDYLQQTLSVFEALLRSFELKLLGAVLTAVYSFFFSIDTSGVMLALLAIICLDLCMGVAAAKKTKEQITSRRILRTAFKLAVYCLLVSAAHLTDVAIGIPPDWINLEAGMIGFLAATELISIIENAGRMGFAVPQKLLNQLNEFRGTDKRNWDSDIV